MISIRLQEIAKLVPNNARVINVGTDHGLLEIYLTKSKNAHCVGTDINKYSVDRALSNIKKCNLNIEIIHTDGLFGVDVNNQIIIISGLGTKTILNILKKRLNNDLIIQSNNNVTILRKEMKRKGYYIFHEKTILDKKWYTIIYFKKVRSFKLCKKNILKNYDYLEYMLNIRNKELKEIPQKRIFRKTKKLLEIKKIRLSLRT